jgi:sugar O-acyltransferase (sialic acid O-acetyltransferase NeuD family)
MSQKPDLFIVGAGGLGREVLAWAHEIPVEKRDWEVKGFLNSIPSALEGYDVSFPIVCDPLDFKFTGTEFIICAIGDPQGKLNLCRILTARGARFTSIIHPSAIVSPSAIIGSGCIIATDTIIGPGVQISPFTTILGSSAIGVDVVVGEGVTISGFSCVGEGAVIKEGAFLGSHAIVAPGSTVGKGARIGARTVVSGDIPAGATFFGIPGQMIAGF